MKVSLKKTEYNEDLRKIWSKLDSLHVLSAPARALQLTSEAMHSYLRTPFTSLLSLFTISIALLLLGICVLLFENIGNYLSHVETGFNVRVYLKDNVAEDRTKELIQYIEKEPAVEGTSFMSKEEALDEFKKGLGEGAQAVFVGLEGQNPLPASLEVSFKEGVFSRGKLSNFAEKIGDQEQVEYVQFSEGVMGQFVSLLRFIRLGGLLMIVFLIIAVAFIVASTVRLALFSKLEEITIMRLVGAPERYVKVPCLIEGGFQGLMGGIISILILYLLFSLAVSLISSSNLMALFLPDFSFLSGGFIFMIAVVGVLIGVGGSYLSIRRFVAA